MSEENGRVRDAILSTKLDYLTTLVEKSLADHEKRLRCLEKREPWRNLAEVITAIIAAVAAVLGFSS
jgi:hypothetical protein